MTLLEQWLLAVIVVLWICGGHAVLAAITFLDGKKPSPSVQWRVLLIWPAAWLSGMFIRNKQKKERQ